MLTWMRLGLCLQGAQCNEDVYREEGDKQWRGDCEAQKGPHRPASGWRPGMASQRRRQSRVGDKSCPFWGWLLHFVVGKNVVSEAGLSSGRGGMVR